jgi:hypothetical protein
MGGGASARAAFGTVSETATRFEHVRDRNPAILLGSLQIADELRVRSLRFGRGRRIDSVEKARVQGKAGRRWRSSSGSSQQVARLHE